MIKITPLGDRMIIKIDETPESYEGTEIVIAEQSKQKNKPKLGTVIAVSPEVSRVNASGQVISTLLASFKMDVEKELYLEQHPEAFRPVFMPGDRLSLRSNMVGSPTWYGGEDVTQINTKDVMERIEVSMPSIVEIHQLYREAVGGIKEADSMLRTTLYHLKQGAVALGSTDLEAMAELESAVYELNELKKNPEKDVVMPVTETLPKEVEEGATVDSETTPEDDTTPED